MKNSSTVNSRFDTSITTPLDNSTPSNFRFSSDENGYDSGNPIERLLADHYRHPGDLRRYDTLGKRKRVAIIGAGVAGLVAGLELSKLDHEVCIFELGTRPGGRVRTHYFSDGTHQELGAMRIPSNHFITLHYINELGLTPQLRRFVNYNPNGFLYLRHKRVRFDQVQQIFSEFNLLDEERRNPFALNEHIMVDAMMRLTEDERCSYFSPLLKGALSKYGNTTMGVYLESLGLSLDAIYLLTHSNGMHQYRSASFAEVLLDFFGLYRMDQFRLVGGMSTLVDAFSRVLGPRIHTHTRVHTIKVRNDGVTIYYCCDNHLRFGTFDYVICAVPAPAVAKLNFEPHLPPAQIDAFRSVTYASAAKTIVHCMNPFWLQDGIKGGGASFADTPLQQVWYPNGDIHPEEACALTASYTWERNARFMCSMDPHERFHFVIKSLEDIHPGCHHYIDDFAHVNWDHETGLGAFAYFAPGDHNRYQKLMEQPFPQDQPRVWFSGEHLSVAHAWIQGALQTGLKAAIAILQIPYRCG